MTSGKSYCHRWLAVCLSCFHVHVDFYFYFVFDSVQHAASRRHGQCSNLFKHPSPTIASSLATEQPKVSDSYLRTGFAHRQSVLTIPLLAWLVNLAELHLSRTCGVAVLAHFFSTLSLLRLNIYCLVYIDFPVTVCWLSCSVPKSRNVNCWLIDWLLLAHEVHSSSKKK